MRKLRLIAALLGVAALTACAAVPIEKMKHSSSILTTGGEGERFKRIPTSVFKLEDRIMLITGVSWSNLDSGAGTHTVLWTWFQNDVPLTKVEQSLNFYKTPYELYGTIPASVMGIGTHRVEVQIDGKSFDTQHFSVSQ